MHISSSIVALVGAAVFMASETLALSSQRQMSNTISNFNHLNPSRSIMQIQRGDLQPVAYVQTNFRQKILYDGHRLNKIRSRKGRKIRNGPGKSRLSRKTHHGKKNRNRRLRHYKRDYATTLKYLKAAMDSYRKDSVTPPPVQLMQLEQQLPPQTPPPPPAFAVPPPPPTEETQITATPDLETANPPLPDLTAQEPISPELGNEISESAPVPVSADIEEDDSFDPEEDPDDVDDPPVVNGVAVPREE